MRLGANSIHLVNCKALDLRIRLPHRNPRTWADERNEGRMSTRLIDASHLRFRERLETVFYGTSCPFVEQLFLDMDFDAWRPQICITDTAYAPINAESNLEHSLGHDESEILDFMTNYISQELSVNRSWCFFGIERLVATAKLPSNRRTARTIREGDYLYTHFTYEHIDEICEYLCTATFLSNCFMLTRLPELEYRIENLPQILDEIESHMHTFIVSALDDDSYLILSPLNTDLK